MFTSYNNETDNLFFNCDHFHTDCWEPYSGTDMDKYVLNDFIWFMTCQSILDPIVEA